MPAKPFLFDVESKSAPSTFEVLFIDSEDSRERTYQYGFSLQGTEVVEEWLYTKAKTARNNYKCVFYRKKGEELQADGLTAKNLELLKIALEKEVLIVSLGAKLKITKLKVVRDWFLKNDVIDFGDPGENFLRSHMLPDHFVDDKEVQKSVVEFISTFDSSIQDFHVEKNPGNEDEKSSYRIETLHKVAGQKELVSIPLGEESSGTLKMFSLYQSLHEALERGGLIFIDELNARLHPLLLRNLILTFTNPEINTHHAHVERRIGSGADDTLIAAG